MNAAIAYRRLQQQFISRVGPRRPGGVVAWFGAIQAQEFDAAKWALGLRMRAGTVDAEIQTAFDEGSILRTHVMRPTWHFVAAPDLRWLLALTAPRVHRVMASYTRNMELDARTLTRGTSVIERALGDERHLTRKELAERLHRAGLPMSGQRLALLVMHAELEAVVCSGPRRGKQFTYGLVAERAANALRVSRDESLAMLGERFLRGHGPATIRDFVWWSGLTTADAKGAVDMVKARGEDIGGRTYWTLGTPRRGTAREHHVHLLPIYDEYLVAYRDREAVPHGPRVIGGSSRDSVTFQHAVVVDGQVAGTWRVTRTPGSVRIHAAPLRRLSPLDRGALGEAVQRYERFLDTRVDLRVG